MKLKIMQKLCNGEFEKMRFMNSFYQLKFITLQIASFSIKDILKEKDEYLVELLNRVK